MKAVRGVNPRNAWLLLWLAAAACVWIWAWPHQWSRACWMGEWPFEAGCARVPAGRAQPVAPAVLREHLRRNAGDSHAYVALLAEQWRHDQTGAMTLLPHVIALAPHDRMTLALRAEAAISSGDVTDAVNALVTLVERGNTAARPALLALMSNPQTRPATLAAVQPGTRWLGMVLSGLDPRVPASPLQPLVARGIEAGVLAPTTVLALVDRLKREGSWLDAYTLWVAWQGRVDEGLFNPGFDRRIQGQGFDWEWTRQPLARQGVRVAQVPALPNAGWMLELEMTGRATLPVPLLSQTLVLLNDRYRLTGRWRADRMRSREGVVWALRCMDGHERMQQSQPLVDSQRQWQTFDLVFHVPAECEGVMKLQLETTNPAEARMGMTGTVNLDDLQLVVLPRTDR